MTKTIEIAISVHRSINEWHDFTIEIPPNANDEALIETILDQIDDDDGWYPGEIHRSFQIDAGDLDGRSIFYADDPVKASASNLLRLAEQTLAVLTDLGIDLDGEDEETIAYIRNALDEAIDKAKRQISSDTDWPSLI